MNTKEQTRNWQKPSTNKYSIMVDDVIGRDIYSKNESGEYVRVTHKIKRLINKIVHEIEKS